MHFFFVNGGGIGSGPGACWANGASAKVASLPVFQSPDDQFGFQPAGRALLHRAVEVLASAHLPPETKMALKV